MHANCWGATPRPAAWFFGRSVFQEREEIMREGSSTTTPAAHRVQEAWSAGRPARNAWLTIPDAYFAEMVASRGRFEAVTLDLQHGLFDRRAAVGAIRAIGAQGAAPLIRLPGADAALAGFLLDAGAVGLICPMVESPTDAEAFVAACRYPPKGRRSFGPTRAGLARDAEPLLQAEHVLAFAMIETRRGLDATETLAAVDGLDGLFVGPGDLGLSLGLGPGQDREEPEIRNALQRVLEACKHAEKRCAVHAGSARYALKMAALGFDLVTAWVDAVAISSTLAEVETIWKRQSS
jgi:4-hydroxy-2-oxoheptanedioate aldolase